MKGWRSALVGLVAVAALVAVGASQLVDGRRPAHEILASHMEGARWYPGRSTLPLPWAPWTAGLALKDGSDLLSSLYAEADAVDPRAVALFLLWRGDPGDLASARKNLEAMEPSAARYNEESLLRLATDEPYAAYEAIQKGLSLEPERLELLFNRAVALEEMSLWLQAREAWADYLARESEGPWAVEARERLASMEEDSSAGPSLESLRYQLREGLLRASSSADMHRLRAIPGMEGYLEVVKREGETIFHQQLDYLSQLDEKGWARRQALVTESDRLRGAILAGRMRWQELQAKAAFAEPLLAVRAAHLAVFEAIQRLDVDAAPHLLDELRSVCARFGCREEAILATSDYGTLLARFGDFQGAKAKTDEALAELPPYLSLRRSEILAKQAAHFATLQAPDAAEKLRREALRLVHVWDEDPMVKEHRSAATANILVATGWGTLNRGLPEVAIAHAKEGKILAERIGSARWAQASALILARATAALGREGEAMELLWKEVALAREAGIPSSTAGLESTLAELLLEAGDGQAALSVADQAIANTRVGSTLLNLVSQLSGRSQIREALGDREGAITDAQEAVDAVERMVTPDLPVLARVRMLAEKGTSHKRLARLFVESNVERDPWPLLGGTSARPLERDECLVAAADFDGQVGVFVRFAGKDAFQLLADGDHALDQRHCPGSVRRVVVLESPITMAGFLAPKVRRERPGAAVVVTRDPSRPWPTKTFSGRALAVHSPEPIVADRVIPRLPAAVEEARLVLQTFPGSMQLRGREATPSDVKAAAPEYDLLHFGVHGEARTGVGAASYLLLGGSAGKLQVVDVLGLSLHRKPVVVLSSCRGGGSSDDRERDGAGLPWAFLEAGAEVVIATQEDLDDRAALAFSEAFYAALSRGMDVSQAFEEAVDALRKKWSHDVASVFTIYI